ncbi:DNA-dependent protein kinase catalytic subunit-like [Panulirus ornatus]|uniref:DNA-dependent protein kinase catalytic subunit-like n=1 Tax=Panulirus ornatus TaxID=150431 RepID=UPI003A8AAB27
MLLYNVDNSTKIRAVALEVFCILLEKCGSHISIEDMNADQFIERICLDIRSPKGSTVLYHQLRTLGMLPKTYPENLRHQVSLILKVFKDQLAKHTGSKPDLIALAGVLRGLTLYLHHFPEGLDDDPQLYEYLYKHIHKVLNPNLNLPRRDAQRAALELVNIHGAKFSTQLFECYDTLFQWLIKWCGSKNRDDHKAAVPAMDTFIFTIANMLELQAVEDKKKGTQVFKYFLREYNQLIGTSGNTSQISLSVKGYGLLSGACRLLLSPVEVYTMFTQVLTASQHAFYQSSEMLENKLSSLPSYIESLALIISNMDVISIGIVDSVQQLALDLVKNFPLVSMYRTFLAYRSLFKLFHAIYNKAEYFQDFLHSFVYKTIVLTCSFAPETESFPNDNGSWKDITTEGRDNGKWSGLKNEVMTYKSFLPLWNALMVPEKVANIRVIGMPATVMTEISSKLYSEYISCTLEITEKLDLNVFKQESLKDAPETTEGSVTATSDPVSGLKAKTPKDFQIYMNVVSLMEEVLPLQCETQLEPHVSRLCWFFVRCSSFQPLVSAHYNAITSIISCIQLTSYFKKKKDPEVETVVHLITSYIRELLQRCRQYRDELLASCLTLILRLPVCIVGDIFPQLMAPLQMALQVGISYLPLAKVCVSALQLWTRILPRDTLHQHLPLVLPLLLPYLHSQETGGEAEVHPRVITVKMAFANQRRKVDQKKILGSKEVDKTEIQKVQLSILHLIGSLDPELSLCVIPQDPDSLAAAAVRWDTHKHIRFATPFEQVKIDVFLDDLLPHVVDLAINSSDRQTKVAASELLHSIIILMIGTGAQQHPDIQARYPMAPLYSHVFQAMLQLACDPDQVTRQLFLTLSYQMIHWFTNNQNFENPDTAVLLEAIMEGIVTVNNPALRDVCAQCLAEFVKWSFKQNKKKDQASLNLKSIFKRIFSLCKHPSAFKRLGGSLAWNSIYREVREDAQAVDIWCLELLIHLISALDLAQTDDPAFGTHEQTKAAISHVEKIISVKKEVFWKKSTRRRIPSELGDGTLDDMLIWLLKQCGRPKALVRHACMELMVSLTPHTQGFHSIFGFIEKHIGKCNLQMIVNIVEGGGEAGLGIKQHSNPTLCSQTEVTLKDMNIFFEALLAALDGYSWFIGRGILSAVQILSCNQVQLFHTVVYFTEHIATLPIPDYLENKRKITSDEVVITPFEYEAATKLKCTVVVRLMDFMTVLLQDGPSSACQLDQNSVWSPQLYELITCCVLDPASIGFDIRDIEVTKHLPSRLEVMLKAMHRSASQAVIQAYFQHLEKQLQDSKYDILKLLPSSVSEVTHIPPRSKHIIEGVEILQKSGWLTESLEVSKTLASDLIKWVCDGLFVERDSAFVAISPHPSCLQYLFAVIHLSVTLDSQVLQQLLSWVTNSESVTGVIGQKIEKGSHILDTLGPIVIPQLLAACDSTLVRVVEMIKDGRFASAMGITATLLNFMIRNPEVRKRHSVKITQAFIYHWPTFSSEAGNTKIHQESVLGLLSSLFLVDREGTMKAHCKDPGSKIVSFYKDLLCDAKVELQLKIKALKLLPFFLAMTEATANCLSDALDVLSFNHFPQRSTEFPAGSARDHEYHQALIEILTALELSVSPLLLQFIVKLFCREEKHRYEEALLESLEKFMKRQSPTQQLQSLRLVYTMFADQSRMKQTFRYNVIEKILAPLLQQANLTPTISFFEEVIKPVMTGISVSVQGRSEEQEKVLITKLGSFVILQIMYSRLPRERVFAPGSEVNSAYRPSDQSGKELTKEVFRYASKIAKGELRHDHTHAELRRLCACAAYNAIIAVLACVQNDLRFYTSFLFSANPTKGEAIWESIIDCNKTHEFDAEVSFNPGSKKRFVALRQELRKSSKKDGGLDSGTVQYMASHFLEDSSLREDVSQFDFSNSVVLAMSETEKFNDKFVGKDADDGEVMTLHLDQSDYNGHEVMASLTAVIHHMVDAEIMVLHAVDPTPSASDVPQWMMLVQQKIESADTPRNVKLFLLRLILNTSRVFSPYAPHFVNSILTCIVDGTVGDRINYFLSDLMVMIMGWGQKAVPPDSIMGRNMAARVLRFLCINTPHTRADIFKYNLDVVRSVVECWKNVLTVPYPIIYSLLEVKDGTKREVETGLQLLGIILANGVAPYTVDSETEKARCESLLVKLLGGHYASVYGAASEVVGLLLSFLSTQEDGGGKSTLEDIVVKKIMELIQRLQGQAITCIYNIHKHYPAVVSRFINKLLNILPKLYGIHRTHVLECLISHCSAMEDVFTHLREQNLLDILARKDPSTQLVSLQLVSAVMHRLTPPHMAYFMSGIVAFASHPAPKCREIMYDVLFWIHDNYRGDNSVEGRKLESEAKVTLLQAMKEEDAALRQRVLNFWLEGSQNLILPQRLLYIMQEIYSPESEDSFLQMAIYILLEATRHSADYHRDIFQQPLTLCRFLDMKVSTTWRARHASMIPLFAETQGNTDSSLNSLLGLTQGSDISDSSDGLDRVQATQANIFSATQHPAGTFNWVTESTFDTTVADKEYEATHAPTLGSAAGLVFNVGSHGKRDMLQYKRPGIGNVRMQPPDKSEAADSASSVHSKLIRRRFVKNQDREQQSIYYAKMEERRSRLREALVKERQLRREAQVTMYRQYRIGELPDIQIPHRAVIAPLQALAQRDGKVARLLFEAIAQGVMDNAEIFLSRGEEDLWQQQLHEALNSILTNSYMCCPEMMRTVLHLMISNDILVNPETLAIACLGSRLEALGILVLERQMLISKRGETRIQPPARKQLKKETEMLSQDAALWLNMAELYKNLDMWDVVRGIVQGNLGNIKKETRAALEAEATNNQVQAFLHYRTALNTTNWEEEPEPAEVRVWEEWYATCAEMLGQWSELENFVENRFLREENGQLKLDRVWLLPHPTTAILPALVHSKLMNILDGAECDGNLFSFIDDAIGEPRHRALLEGELPLQLAVMSLHQQKIAQAQSFLTTATSATLRSLAQYSLLTPKPLIATLRSVQLLTEFGDFLNTIRYTGNDSFSIKVKQKVSSWKKQGANLTDSSLLVQCLSSYRNLYLHLLEKELSEDCPQDVLKVIKDTKTSIHRSVIRAAIVNRNYHLATRHLKKLKPLSEDSEDSCSIAQFFFLMTETNILRGQGKPSSRLQYLVEAWAKFLGKVSSMPILEQDASVEVQYLRLESSLCYEICESIREMGDEWHPKNQYMQVLATKFSGLCGRESWYNELLGCSYKSLKHAVRCAEDNLPKLNEKDEVIQNPGKDVHMTLAKYCEDCLENWSDNIDAYEYSKSLVISVLRSMALGSRDAHFHFPRLINLMEEDPSLVKTFRDESERVPTWMFLLWLSHILIYVDKASGPALQPIVEKLAAEYPQAVVYPFGISVQHYNFTSNSGKSAKVMCQKVESLLSSNSLLHQFVSAISLMVVPFIAFKDRITSLMLEKDKKCIEDRLKKIECDFLKLNNRSTKGTALEKGEIYLNKDRIMKDVVQTFNKSFGEGLKKIKTMSVPDIMKALESVKKKTGHTADDLRRLPRQLKAYSPWLANFHASKYSEVLELPGQYSGMSKPLPEYHVKISSFDENLMLMPSLRIPMRIIVRGDDEKDHKFLVKWGEDLRTDQRMEQMFTLMNTVYCISPFCARTTSRPSLVTYQVVPLSLEVGLLQWVEATQPLKEFMNDSYKENEKRGYEDAYAFYRKSEHWDIVKKSKKKDVVKAYKDVVNKIPWDLLRRGLVKLSCSSEGFFSLRSAFAVSYATLCISHWLLGIGDRHCGNSLLSLKTGRVVGIDFGHHFESAAQFLPVPELMPFRLTPQIANAFQPVGQVGMLREIMVSALGALQESRHVLIAVLEAFVKEPTKDWLEFVRRQEGNVEVSNVEMFSQDRIKLLKAKLNGVNPANVTMWAVSQNRHVKKDHTIVECLRQVILGIKGENMRADIGKNELSTHLQVDVLLEQACDPNILGRTWIGWEPFM